MRTQQPPARPPADPASVDHRRLGRELRLFDTDPLVGAGLPLWLPDGAVIRAEIERLAAEEALRGGCQRVYTPVLAKRELYERSGHWAKFADDMFPPIRVGERGEGEGGGAGEELELWVRDFEYECHVFRPRV